MTQNDNPTRAEVLMLAMKALDVVSKALDIIANDMAATRQEEMSAQPQPDACPDEEQPAVERQEAHFAYEQPAAPPVEPGTEGQARNEQMNVAAAETCCPMAGMRAWCPRTPRADAPDSPQSWAGWDACGPRGSCSRRGCRGPADNNVACRTYRQSRSCHACSP